MGKSVRIESLPVKTKKAKRTALVSVRRMMLAEIGLAFDNACP
jgi:hypothetical protein